MKLYQVSFDLERDNDLLLPYIPLSAGYKEDKVTKRICLSDTPSHCMQAIAGINRDIYEGKQFLLKEIEIDEKDKALIEPEFLFFSKKVPDALENREYWYLKERKSIVSLCEITKCSHDFTIAWTCNPLKECKDIISKYTDMDLSSYFSSEAAYDAFFEWANKNQMWYEMDAVWDELLELPWSQKTKINVEYTVIEKYFKYRKEKEESEQEERI